MTLSGRIGLAVLTLVVAVTFTAVPGFAQEEKKAGGPCGLPDSAALKEKLSLNDEQVGKIDAIYAEYKGKAEEAASDKAKSKELKAEICGKVKEVLNDDQKKTFDELTAGGKKKKEGGEKKKKEGAEK